MNFKLETTKNKKKNTCSFLGLKKISLFLSFFMIFSAFAYPKAYTQNDISFDVENETIISVLDKIESQTPLRFIFGSEIYDFEKTITLTVEKASLKDVIYLIFDNKLSYELSDDVVILSKSVNEPKESSKKVSIETNQQKVVEIIVTGNVTDNNGYPLPGAAVVELGTSNGTTTDFDGNFSISVNDENSILEISYIGFVTQKVTADANNPISVTMKTDVSSLENVVLV
ncbi:MAG: carboxypeptidase-like regulatory domain-containing protein, partial [Flavobacteriaceae bacterium]|nr:carboxypeptidase-like regulatory domain-containing protein [Flavobacteriaceae bacterium]